jgi:ribosomal protein L37AE/L43A
MRFFGMYFSSDGRLVTAESVSQPNISAMSADTEAEDVDVGIYYCKKCKHMHFMGAAWKTHRHHRDDAKTDERIRHIMTERAKSANNTASQHNTSAMAAGTEAEVALDTVPTEIHVDNAASPGDAGEPPQQAVEPEAPAPVRFMCGTCERDRINRTPVVNIGALMLAEDQKRIAASKKKPKPKAKAAGVGKSASRLPRPKARVPRKR